MRFVQLLQVSSNPRIIWGLDPNGEIWECLDKRIFVEGRVEFEPLSWQRLEFRVPGPNPRTAQMDGAEKFRAHVLKRLQQFQGDPGASQVAKAIMRDLEREIATFDILEALGLK